MSAAAHQKNIECPQQRQFGVRTLLGVTTLCAVVFAIPHQPFFGTILVLTYLAAAAWRLPSNERLSARMAHDAVLGFALGFLVPALWLSLLVHATNSNDQVADATVRLLTGPVVGCVCGATLAVLRHRR